MESKVEFKSRWVQEKWAIREVYDEVVVWLEQWKVWRGIFKEVGEELAKMEVSSSGGETLKGE